MTKKKPDDPKNIIDKVIDKPVAVFSVSDGWVFKFSREVLQELVDASKESPTGDALVFVKAPKFPGN